jgi:hypothetical protein
MDARRFDALAKVLSVSDSRRRLLKVLVTLPVLGGLFGSPSPDDAEGKGRRMRRKKRHKHGKGRRRNHGKHKNKRPQCTPDSIAQTCAGTCGSVQNNCQQAVDCGSCACDPACQACFICQDAPTTSSTCVVDPGQAGDACGNPGQFCQANGRCACDAASCPPPQTCSSSGACFCTPKTCTQMGATCGTISDGCGGLINCGPCSQTTPICSDNVCVA